MYHTAKEKGLIGLTLFVLCAEIAILCHFMKWIELPFMTGRVGKVQAIGTLTEQSGSVRVRTAGNLTWYPIGKNDDVQLYDTLFTTAGASGEVKLKAGGEIALGPNTLIRFSPTRGADGSELFHLEVTRGSVKVKTKKRVQLSMREKKVELEEGTRAEVSVQAIAPTTEVAVQEGKVVVMEEAAPVQEIVQGQRIALVIEPEHMAEEKAERLPAATQPLVFEPVSPTSNRVYFPDSPFQEVQFDWKGAPDAQVEISHNALFESGRVYEDRNPKRLPPGRYFWRLKDKERRSPSSMFVVMPPVTYKIKFPMPDRAIALKPKTVFEWEKIASAEGYVLELSKTPEFESPESKWVSTNTTELELEAGTYYWRVRARHVDLGEWQVSPVYKFKLNKKISAPKTKGVKILPKKKSHLMREILEMLIPTAHAEEAPPERTHLLFQWEAVEDAVGYQLEVSDRKDFRNILLKKDTTETLYDVELPYRPKFYWRVSAKDVDGILGEPSAPEVLVVERTLPLPPKKVVEKKQELEKPPVIAEPTLKDSMPKPKGLFSVPQINRSAYSLFLGYGSVYQNAETSTDNFNLETSGLTASRWSGDLILPFSDWSFALSFDYQRFEFLSDVTQIAAFQHDLRYEYYHGQILAFETHFLNGEFFPVFGLNYERRPTFRRRANEVVDLQTIDKGSLLLGAGLWIAYSKNFGVSWRALADLAPLGRMRGAGALLTVSPYLQIPKCGTSLMLRMWGRGDVLFLSPEINSIVHLEFGGSVLFGFSLPV